MLLCIKQKLPAHSCPLNQIFPGPFCCVCHHNGSEAFLGITMNMQNGHLRIQRDQTSLEAVPYKHHGTKISTTGLGLIIAKLLLGWRESDLQRALRMLSGFLHFWMSFTSLNNVTREKKEGHWFGFKMRTTKVPKYRQKPLVILEKKQQDFKRCLNSQDHWHGAFLEILLQKLD